MYSKEKFIPVKFFCYDVSDAAEWLGIKVYNLYPLLQTSRCLNIASA